MNQYFGIDLAKNFVKDIVKIRFLSNSNLEPLILAYFITFRCNLNCSYCNYIQERFELKYKEVNTQQAKLILHQCRKKVPSVAFTGGEPLIRDDIVEIIQFAKELRFKPISLFTNGLLLQQKEAVLENIDFIQISLDSVIEQKNHGNRDREKLIEIIQKYSKLQYKKNFKININCVINSENIEEIPELLNFAKQLNVKLTVCPELNEMAEPVDELKNGESGKKYRQMIDYLLE